MSDIWDFTTCNLMVSVACHSPFWLLTAFPSLGSLWKPRSCSPTGLRITFIVLGHLLSTYYALDSTYIISFDCHNILVRLLLPYPFYRAGKLRLREGEGVIRRVRRKGSQVEDTAHAKARKWASQMVHRYDRSPICWELTLAGPGLDAPTSGLDNCQAAPGGWLDRWGNWGLV